MKAAIIISFVSGLVDIYSFGYLLLVQAPKLSITFSELNVGIINKLPFYIGVLLGIILILGNFVYAYYLYKKVKKNEIVKDNLIWSIFLGPVLFFVYLGFMTFAIIWPIYTLTSNF